MWRTHRNKNLNIAVKFIFLSITSNSFFLAVYCLIQNVVFLLCDRLIKNRILLTYFSLLSNVILNNLVVNGGVSC